MNVRKFAAFLISVALLGLLGSGFYKSSGEFDSNVRATYFRDEISRDAELAIKRAQQGYADEDSVRETRKIAGAREERRSYGQTGLMVFAGVGVLALGLLLSAKPTT